MKIDTPFGLHGRGCARCGGDRWVCENHLDRAQDHDDDCGGAGVPCPECNPLAMAHLDTAPTAEGAVSRVEPALTPEDWELELLGSTRRRIYEGEVFLEPDYGLSVGYDSGCASTRIGDPHRAAALCLHGQPFGFIWEDVDRLRAMEGVRFGGVDEMDWVRSLADRIAALLPPREP